MGDEVIEAAVPLHCSCGRTQTSVMGFAKNGTPLCDGCFYRAERAARDATIERLRGVLDKHAAELRARAWRWASFASDAYTTANFGSTDREDARALKEQAETYDGCASALSDLADKLDDAARRALEGSE